MSALAGFRVLGVSSQVEVAVKRLHQGASGAVSEDIIREISNLSLLRHARFTIVWINSLSGDAWKCQSASDAVSGWGLGGASWGF